MNAVVTRLLSIVRREEGQDLLEYALLAALISLVAITAITSAGTKVNQVFTSVANSL
jgi:pilus assembly protein Flp/PilA